MPFVAEAERAFDRSPEEVFDRLADACSWRDWMPKTFRAVATPEGPLRSGDRLRVRIGGGPPVTLEVVVSDRGRELTWIGGVRGVFFAEHRFLFETREGGGAVVRSIETWSGALSRLAKRLVVPVATKIGRAQLEGLGRSSA